MGSTNKTANLELSQFLGSDSPKWLTDYNADMQKIDTGVATVKAQADATDIVVGGHSTAITSLQGTTAEQTTAITTLQTDVSGNTGSINTINSLIGNGEPTTTDKTIIGAINELHSNESIINTDITNLKNSLEASFITSGIDSISYTPDGSESVESAMNALLSLFNTLIADHIDKYFELIEVTVQGIHCNVPINTALINTTISNINAAGFAFSGGKMHMRFAHLDSNENSNALHVLDLDSTGNTMNTYTGNSTTASNTYSIKYRVIDHTPQVYTT